VRLLFGALFLAILAYLVDVRVVVARLAEMDARWVGVAVGIGIGQTILSAWRWRFTAGRLGLLLPLPEALGEYYRGLFLNQIVPGGVVGDASRAWRHASRTRSEWGPAVRAVILERVSGQAVMAVFAGISFASLAPRLAPGRAWLAPLAVTVVAAVALVAWRVRIRPPVGHTAMRVFVRDAGHALFARDAVAIQLVTSSVIVGSYVVTYLCAARAVGVETAWPELAVLVPPVLIAMLVPLSVGGWGLREGAAAGLWAAVGLGAADGVAISMAYGLIVLLGTLPGAYLIAFGGLRATAGLAGNQRAREPSSSRSNRTSSPSAK
jgi:uncharacterized membrane protein YbhN (UPF0104 family)